MTLYTTILDSTTFMDGMCRITAVSHYRRVAWNTELSAELLNLQKEQGCFSHLKSVPTFTRVDETVWKHVKAFIGKCKPRALALLPDEPSEIFKIDQRAGKLFDRGISSNDVSSVRKTIERAYANASEQTDHTSVLQSSTDHQYRCHRDHCGVPKSAENLCGLDTPSQSNRHQRHQCH